MPWRGIRRISRSKYGNVPTIVDGYRFDSGSEANRYCELKQLQAAGEISGLEVDKKQLRYPLVVNGIKICTYVADYRYVERGQLIVEDRKGKRTRDYVMKRKLMKACHGIEIRETSDRK